jgi:hypothetical protein
MKKIQFIFAGAALLLASVGVFANNLFVTTYYQSQTAGAVCTTTLTTTLPTGCTTGSLQCQKTETINGEVITFNISRIVDNGPCEIVPRP